MGPFDGFDQVTVETDLLHAGCIATQAHGCDHDHERVFQGGGGFDQLAQLLAFDIIFDFFDFVFLIRICFWGKGV